MKFQAASILQPTGQLTKVTAVQIQSDSEGLAATFHLVTHWCVCKKRGEVNYDNFVSISSQYIKIRMIFCREKKNVFNIVFAVANE